MPQNDIHKHLIQIRWKPIGHVIPKTDQCAMCYQEYEANMSIVECQQCHQHLHGQCQLEWCLSNIFSNVEPTCPFCRSTWQNNPVRLYPLIDPHDDPVVVGC